MTSNQPNTLDKYLVNCFIEKASNDHDIPKQDLLNTWYSINGSFSLSHVSEEVDENNDDYFTREIVYSYESVFGCETERDLDTREKIAQDIKISIEEYMGKNYPEYYVSIAALFDGKNYEIELYDDSVTMYINGPEKEIDCIKMQLDSMVQHLYSCKTNSTISNTLSSLTKYFWL